MLKKDKDKNRARERYIVIKLDKVPGQCWIKKLENQIRQENYLVKNTEIELCPKQSLPKHTQPCPPFNSSPQFNQKDPKTMKGNTLAKHGWDSHWESSSEEDPETDKDSKSIPESFVSIHSEDNSDSNRQSH